MPEGFEFYGAADGVEALEFIASCKFDLIILDIDMPRLNGIELLRAARSREVETPVILYTGESRSAKIKEFMKLGIDDFILKPCAADFLREKIIFVATQRAIQVDEPPKPESIGPTPTQIVPPPTVLSGAKAPPLAAPPTVSAPQGVKNGGPGFSALFVVQQVRYPSRIFEVTTPSIILGRGASVDLKLPHQSVSRQHAKLEYKNGEFILTDLGSANGTLVKEKPVQEHRLKADDVVHIGDFFLVFKLENSKQSLSWMENYDVCDKEAAEQVEGGTRMLSPEALMDAMQHVSLRNSTVLVRGDDETVAYALGEMHHTFGAGGIPCDGVTGPADVHVFWDGDSHRVKRISGNSEVVWVNGEMVREKDLALGDEIRVGGSSFYYKISG